jgi:hypothetical protein
VHPRTATCLAAPSPTSLLRRAPALLGRASDPVSLLGRAPVLPRVTWFRTLPPCSVGLRCCHVSHGSGPCLLAQEGSSAAMCPTALNHASLLRRAPMLSNVSRDPQRAAGLKNKEKLS